MRQIIPGSSGPTHRMVGPDGAIYVISDNGLRRTANPPTTADIPLADIPVTENIRIRNDIQKKLGHLPQMPAFGPC